MLFAVERNVRRSILSSYFFLRISHNNSMSDASSTTGEKDLSDVVGTLFRNEIHVTIQPTNIERINVAEAATNVIVVSDNTNSIPDILVLLDVILDDKELPSFSAVALPIAVELLSSPPVSAPFVLFTSFAAIVALVQFPRSRLAIGLIRFNKIEISHSCRSLGQSSINEVKTLPL